MSFGSTQAGKSTLIHQRKLVKNLLGNRLIENATWYLVSTDWWLRWKAYVLYDQPDSQAITDLPAGRPSPEHPNYPGPIDNQPLSRPEFPEELKPDIVESRDFVLIPDTAWINLEESYGSTTPLPRKVISTSARRNGVSESSSFSVELYPIRFYLFSTDSFGKPQLHSTQGENACVSVKYFSKSDTYGKIRKQLMTWKLSSSSSLSSSGGRTMAAQTNEKNFRIWARSTPDDVESVVDVIKHVNRKLLTRTTSTMQPINNNDDDDDEYVMVSKTGDEEKATAMPVDSDSDDDDDEGGHGWMNIDGEEKLSANDTRLDAIVAGMKSLIVMVEEKVDFLTLVDAYKVKETGQADLSSSSSSSWLPEADAVINSTHIACLKSLMTKFFVSGILILKTDHKPKSSNNENVRFSEGEMLQCYMFPRDYAKRRSHLSSTLSKTITGGDVRVDASDESENWYESIVLSSWHDIFIFVHYHGWDKVYDTWMVRGDECLDKLYSQTDDWRTMVVNRTRDKVECLTNVSGVGRKWYACTVKEIKMEKKMMMIDDGGETIKRMIRVGSDNVSELWVDLDSEVVAEVGYHDSKNVSRKGNVEAKKVRSNANYTSSSSSSSHHTTYSTSSSSSSSYNDSRSFYSNTRGTPTGPGIVGLSNLGNTCFMNSMLQCISNIPEITDYFLQDRHVNDINTKNPLGTGGKLADAYGKFIKEVWSGDYVTVVPSNLKRTIGDFASQFAGYQQQDSQELMSFLLDGLHEDLNRVRNKPYVETLESDDRPDELVARESWRRFLARNSSHIVDTCYGLLRSDVTCPRCRKKSITFDPFMSLSLPIPVKNTKSIKVLFFPLPSDTTGNECFPAPIAMTCDVVMTSSCRDFKLQVNQMYRDRCPSSLSSHPSCFYQLCVPSSPSFSCNIKDVKEAASIVSETAYGAGGGQGGFHAFVYQVEHDNGKCWSDYAVSSSSSRSIFSSSSSSSTDPLATPIRLVDVFTCQEKRYQGMYGMMNNSHLEPHTFVRRMSYNEETVVSNLDMHRLLFKIASRFMAAFDLEVLTRLMNEGNDLTNLASRLPYRVVMTSPYASSMLGEVPINSSRFEITSYKALAIAWKESDLNKVDDEELRRTLSLQDLVSDRNGVVDDGRLTLSKCFDKFTEREQLGETEQWFCPTCRELIAPLKKFDIFSAPDILIVHLKRFQYVPGTYFVHREKIMDDISFPVESLDLSHYVKFTTQEATPVYDLFAVSEHSGGMGGGHYTTVAKNHSNGKWYDFNDSSVREDSPDSAMTPRAYVLFYRRRVGHARWGGIVPTEDGELARFDATRPAK